MFKREEIFELELSYIKNESIKNFAKRILQILPEYFFEVPASSTGKYHPEYALGDGGLVRHTKAAIDFAVKIMTLEQCTFTNDEKDIIIAALMIHDGCKSGIEKSDYSVADHPLQVVEHIKRHSDITAMIDSELFETFCSAVSSHMGEWTSDYKTKKEILPKPKTEIEKFVHTADYIASRKDWIFTFPNGYYKPSDFVVNSGDELQNNIHEIIRLCKEKIQNGGDKETYYSAIAELNGNKNPNSITDNSIAVKILEKIKEL